MTVNHEAGIEGTWKLEPTDMSRKVRHSDARRVKGLSDVVCCGEGLVCAVSLKHAGLSDEWLLSVGWTV